MSRGAQRFGSTKSFAKHRAGGGGRFLSKWKEKGSIDVWFHTKEMPIAVWRHQFPTMVVRKDRDTKDEVTHVWSKDYVCHEDHDVLEDQYKRDRDTGERKSPPERCAICKLAEWCYQQARLFEETRDDKRPKGLSAVTPLFRFEGDDPKETTTLHIGGICNLFKRDDLSDALKKEMKEAKIFPKEAWKQNAWARCQYAMFVVDNNHPDNGVQIAVEAGLLGEKVKEVMNDELDKNDIDIQTKPYCMQWEYFEKETNFQKKYKASVLRKQKATGRILELIRGDEVPELPDDLTVPFNQLALRAVLESKCVLPNHEKIIPWDEIFPSAEQIAKWAKADKAEAERAKKAAEEEAESDDDADDADEPDADDDADDAEEKPKAKKADADDDEDDEDEDDEQIACDDCGKPMSIDDTECASCGATYDPKTGKYLAPGKKKDEPKKMRTRSEAAAAKAEKPEKKPAKKSADDDGAPGDDGDDGLPF